MPVTFHDILDQLEAASLDKAEKGRRFEELMVSYLKTDPAYAEMYEEVWLWNDYPDRGNRPDTGVDLVAKKSGTDELTAIQCKFFAPTTTIQKSQIDSFLAASSKKEFARRMIITTSDRWGKNSEETIRSQDPPVDRLRARDLDLSPIDWSQFSLDKPSKLVKKPPKEPRDYQQDAIKDVLEGFEKGDRGKLIMACGTGKTFTSLKLAEEMVPDGGTALFLVPSISLLGQTLREWTAEAKRSLRSFAVCSDVSVGKRKTTEDISITDLAYPATTSAEKLAKRFEAEPVRPGGFTVVFSTYQSIEAVAGAQAKGIPEFDMIISDEAHRTTGVTLEGDDESAFVRVHDQEFLSSKKRLYMTATPRIYGDAAKSKADKVGAVLADMADESLFGPEFHRLGFAKAVEKEILTDYKVLVLAVDEGHVGRQFQGLLANNDNELRLEDAAKLVGCWNGLAKRGNHEGEFDADPEPMKRAVAFAGTIKTSKMVAASFDEVVDTEIEDMVGKDEALACDVRHVDGTQSSLVRNEALDWLREEPDEGECRILSNAKCLSEGVDVPALDAVLFLAPRKSQVDVVQSVGRVMRKLEGKRYGYVILPVGVPSDTEPEEALADNKKYQVVWQVLQALRSHDERLNAIINKLDLTGNDTKGKISVIGVGGEKDPDRDKEKRTEQLALAIPNLDQWRDSIFARIVEKVGDRQYWENWAKDIASIAQAHITRIMALVEGSDAKLREEFEQFLRGLRDNLNPYLSREEAIEMLAQHLITRPVFDALFEDYSFSDSNPVSQVMQAMLDAIEPEHLEKERVELDEFYESVRMRAAGIDNAKAKQGIVKDLYETFFRLAFPSTADRLGIVYTPTEIVDFILNSADEALRDHFGVGLTDKDVHILDPFTGTGTFIVRLIQSGLIGKEDLERKFRHELHANEIVLLAYYVAAINIEEAYHDQKGGSYEPFEGIVLTDTFQMHEGDDRDELPGMEVFPENNERVVRQKQQPIRVIVGNPPYSARQSTANDDNQNLVYRSLDARIEESYADKSGAKLKNSLYDSYIRAFRWASDRIGDQGIICFVSNGGFIDGNMADGLRKSLAEEFSQISVFNLRGNARGSGEERRKEKGNVFGSGSRTTIAITLLVKDPDATEEGRLVYRDIGDYLTREEKLGEITAAGKMGRLDLKQIEPNSDGDWIDQRDPTFLTFDPIGTKGAKGDEAFIFDSYSAGVKTNRDAWVWGFSRSTVEANSSRMIDAYNAEVERFHASYSSNARPTINDLQDFVDRDPRALNWDGSAEADAVSGKLFALENGSCRRGMYRPFCKQWIYFGRELNNRVYQLPAIFPSPDLANVGFHLSGVGAQAPFLVLMADEMPDVQLTSNGQFFPRYTYVEQGGSDNLLDAAADDGRPYRRVDNITEAIHAQYRKAYGEDVTKDDIFFYVYGLLHSPEYRSRFQPDLKKMLPRIPKVEDFREFSDAGRQLSDLHLGYESVDLYELEITERLDSSLRVKKMKFGGSGKSKDRSTIIYNDQITVTGIPEEAYRYMLGSRSAIELVMDRYQVKTDSKSGIVNDPNDWAKEHGEPRYILNLLCRIVTVSIETMKIVDGLPKLELLESKGT